MKTNKRTLNKAGTFITFMGPMLISFTCVLLIPFLYGVYLTFTNYDPIKGTKDFIGLANFAAIFTDKEFRGSL